MSVFNKRSVAVTLAVCSRFLAICYRIQNNKEMPIFGHTKKLMRATITTFEKSLKQQLLTVDALHRRVLRD